MEGAESRGLCQPSAEGRTGQGRVQHSTHRLPQWRPRAVVWGSLLKRPAVIEGGASRAQAPCHPQGSLTVTLTSVL